MNNNRGFWDWLKPKLKVAWSYIKKYWKRFQINRWLILLVLTFILVLSGFWTYKAKTSNIEDLKASLQTKTVVVDKDGDNAGALYSRKGTYVGLDDISTNIQNAVISTEDRTFWTNPGFSIKGYARAAVGYLLHRGISGGSTLTQQLAKNSLLTQKQTLSRKGEELFLSIEINKVYSKKSILAMYLNNAYFGNGVWGVQDASKKYFGKNASELDPGEAAVLAAILKSPNAYNPIDNMANSKARRNLVLSLMVDNNKLSSSQAKYYQNTPIDLTDDYQESSSYKYPYFFDAVIAEAVNKYGLSEDSILNKGYKIYTTLDQNMQSSMEKSFDSNYLFPSNASDGKQIQGASIAIDPKTGGVSAVVGGRGEHTFRGFNRATQMTSRSPGSTIKPLAVYTPALQNGYHYDSELPDEVTSFGKNKYTPTNADGLYQEKIPMYKALAQSENVPAVALLDKIGVKKGVASVENFGINVKKKDQNLALALGGLSTGVSPEQMARAYTAFANEGKLSDTHFITKIVDATGTVIVDNTSSSTKQIIDKDTAKEMTSMMLGVYNEGTGASAKPSGYKIAGKTGSTEVPRSFGQNGTKDQWMIGYTPDIVVASWIGFDQTDSTHFIQGVNENGVAPLFKDEMTNILPYTDGTAFNTKDAAEIANENNNDNSDNDNDFLKSFEDGVNGVKDKANEWYNEIKNFFGQ